MSDVSIGLPPDEPGETGPYALMVVLTVKPGRVDEVIERFLGQIDTVRAEPANVTYNLHRDRTEPNVLVFYESYRGAEGFGQHLAEDYNAAIVSDLPELLEKDIEIRFLRMLSEPA